MRECCYMIKVEFFSSGNIAIPYLLWLFEDFLFAKSEESTSICLKFAHFKLF